MRLQCTSLTRAGKVDLPARIDVHEYVRAHSGLGSERHTEKTASLSRDFREKDGPRPILQVGSNHVPLTVCSHPVCAVQFVFDERQRETRTAMSSYKYPFSRVCKAVLQRQNSGWLQTSLQLLWTGSHAKHETGVYRSHMLGLSSAHTFHPCCVATRRKASRASCSP